MQVHLLRQGHIGGILSLHVILKFSHLQLDSLAQLYVFLVEFGVHLAVDLDQRLLELSYLNQLLGMFPGFRVQLRLQQHREEGVSELL